MKFFKYKKTPSGARLLIFSSYLFFCLLIVGISLYKIATYSYLAIKTGQAESFGIAPPYFYNEKLYPGAVYETEIRALRGRPEGNARIKATLDMPLIADWFGFSPSDTFTIADGSLQAPLWVKVSVPSDAVPGRYRGALYIGPESAGKKGGVGIRLGGLVDINLLVQATTTARIASSTGAILKPAVQKAKPGSTPSKKK